MNKPSAIILGVDSPIGLAIIRELSENSVRVIGIGNTLYSIGKASKHLHAFYRREIQSEQLVEQIISIKDQHDCVALFAIAENDIEILNSFRSKLSSLALMFAPQDAMDKVLDKKYTYDIAKKVGIDCPESWQISQIAELDIIREEIYFPVVLKWRNPQHIMPRLQKHQVEFIKTEYADNFIELKEKLSRYSLMGEFPLFQVYCHGNGLGQFFLIHQGKVIQRFQHQRLHEWPPEGGTSTLCKSLDNNQHKVLLDKSAALLIEMGWEGVAMVEYRYDSKADKALLMEINGRFWGSLPLAYYANANFAWLLFCYKGLNRIAPTPKIKPNIYCMFGIPEFRRLIRVLFQPNCISDKFYKNTPIKDFLLIIYVLANPRGKSFVFSWTDPRPFITDVKQAFKKAIRKA